jgi:hypothetical protein
MTFDREYTQAAMGLILQMQCFKSLYYTKKAQNQRPQK